MSTWTERKIAHDLSERDSIEPPEGLLDKIKSEIPADLGSRLPAAALREAQSAQVVAMPRRQRWLLAASLILMLGGGLFAAVVMRQGVSMEEAAEEAEPAAPSVAGEAPAPQRAEPLAGSSEATPAEPLEAEPAPVTQPPADSEAKQSLRALGYVGNETPKEEAASRVAEADDLPSMQGRRDSADQTKSQAVALSEAAPPAPPAAPAPELEEGVDIASYTAASRSLREGRLPPREAIRVADFVSSFSYGDPPPAQGDFALRAEGAASIFAQGPRTYLLRFNLRAREVKVEEPTGTVPAIAEDAKVQVEFFPAAVARWRLIGDESWDVPDEKLRDDAVDAGEIGAGQSVTALYEVQLTPRANGKIASLHLRYRVPVTGQLRETVRDLRASELVPDLKDASPGSRLASLVVEFAETLRGSSHGGDLQDILRRARLLAEETAGQPQAADAAELARLVAEAVRIKEAAEKK